MLVVEVDQLPQHDSGNIEADTLMVSPFFSFDCISCHLGTHIVLRVLLLHHGSCCWLLLVWLLMVRLGRLQPQQRLAVEVDQLPQHDSRAIEADTLMVG